ncbi:MAG: DUF349 domain-containing protein [Mycobacterium leprae]
MSDARRFGRVAEDGTVYVRTRDGERPVGSWHAGPAEDGLAFYARKYDELATEVDLLASRVAAGSGNPATTRERAVKLREGLGEAHVVGDLDALAARLDALVVAADERKVATAAERERRAAEAVAAKTRLAEEAERLADSDDWKASSERFRALTAQWRDIHGVDRRTDNELWARVSAARKSFDRRRKEHFASVDEQRRQAQARKEALVAQAEELAGSSDWAATATRLKELMAEWKRAGRASREVDDALWARFRATQDRFFARRSEVYAERDAAFRANQDVKEALLAEAEALDASTDLAGAQRRLREIQQRWAAAGPVPRDMVGVLEKRLGAVEERVRAAAQVQWRRADRSSSPLLVRLRESVGKLEGRVERARAAGDTRAAAEAEAALATQRAWLEQAERS